MRANIGNARTLVQFLCPNKGTGGSAERRTQAAPCGLNPRDIAPVTRLRIDQNDRFFPAAPSAQSGSAQTRMRSSPLATSHTTRPIHTQELTGSSPVAPWSPGLRAVRAPTIYSVVRHRKQAANREENYRGNRQYRGHLRFRCRWEFLVQERQRRIQNQDQYGKPPVTSSAHVLRIAAKP
jgi:hypothetical protein